MAFYLETERLYLREVTTDDAEEIFKLNLDPEVIRHTGDEPFETVEDTKVFLSKYKHYEKYGFGRWGVIRKEDEAFLGWCGLKYSSEVDEYDLGFRFFKEYWNQGYATEAAVACLDVGFNKFNIKTIYGRAKQENLPSIRIIEKLGLTYMHDKLEEEDTWKIFSKTI